MHTLRATGQLDQQTLGSERKCIRVCYFQWWFSVF